jgi:hypothetical protein
VDECVARGLSVWTTQFAAENAKRLPRLRQMICRSFPIAGGCKRSDRSRAGRAVIGFEAEIDARFRRSEKLSIITAYDQNITRCKVHGKTIELDEDLGARQRPRRRRWPRSSGPSYDGKAKKATARAATWLASRHYKPDSWLVGSALQ